MFRRDKNNKLDNEGLRRMREAIRQRLDEETAAAGETTQPAYPPATPTGEGAYAYESLPAEPDYSYLREHEAGQPREEAQPAAATEPRADSAPPVEQSEWTAPTSPASTMVAADATWNGTLRSSADIRVEGAFDGEIETEQTLHVAPAAKVDATVRATSIVVAGHLTGNIECRERLEVLPSGHISGQIQAGAIIVQEGAFLGGQLRMKSQETADEGDPSRPMLQRVR